MRNDQRRTRVPCVELKKKWKEQKLWIASSTHKIAASCVHRRERLITLNGLKVSEKLKEMLRSLKLLLYEFSVQGWITYLILSLCKIVFEILYLFANQPCELYARFEIYISVALSYNQLLYKLEDIDKEQKRIFLFFLLIWQGLQNTYIFWHVFLYELSITRKSMTQVFLCILLKT